MTVEGLVVTIEYDGAKRDQVASPATPSSELAILKKDLAHLRVHSPSQKNVHRVNGAFILHWPTAGTSPKVTGLADSLHTRWSKLCSNDPEALELRKSLSIGSIAMIQDGVVIRSTAGAVLASQDALLGVLGEKLGDPLPETAQQPAPASSLAPSLPTKPSPPVIPPHRVTPTAPRVDRQAAPQLKRRMSSAEGSSTQTRQKLDAPEAPSTNADMDTEPRPHPSLEADQQDRAATKAFPHDDDASTRARTPTAPIPDAQTPSPSPSREPGEMTPSGSGSSPAGRPPPPHRPTQPRSAHGPRPASPHASPSSSGNGGDAHALRRRDRDVNRLTRELWDTRHQLTAVLAREQVILDDLERLGVRPEGASGGGGPDRNGVGAARDELEAELKAERARRVRAERALSDVERECRTPFVVPALFQAFMNISELSS